MELYGTEGTLLIEEEQIRLISSNVADGNWASPEDSLPALAMLIEQWRQLITEGTKPTITKEDVIQLTRVNEAAALSQQENRRIVLNKMPGE